MRRILGWLYRRLTPGCLAALVFVATAAALWWTLPVGPVAVFTMSEPEHLIAFSPDGRTLATGKYAPTSGGSAPPPRVARPLADVTLWDIPTARRAAHYGPAVPGSIPHVAEGWFTPGGEFLLWDAAPADAGDAVLLLHPRTGARRELVRVPADQGPVRAALPCLGGHAVLVASATYLYDPKLCHNHLEVFDLADGRRRVRVATERLAFAYPVVSADGRFLAALTVDPADPDERVVGVWDLESEGGRLCRRIRVLGRPTPTDFVFSPEGRYLTLIGDNMSCWEVVTGQLLGKSPEGTGAGLRRDPWFTPDGGLCLERDGGARDSITCYAVPGLEVRWRLPRPRIISSSRAPDERLLAVANVEEVTETLCVVSETSRGEEVARFTATRGKQGLAGFWGAAFVPRSGLLVVLRCVEQAGNRWLAWLGGLINDAELGREREVYELLVTTPRAGPASPLRAIPCGFGYNPIAVFSPDGRLLAAYGPEWNPYGTGPTSAGPYTVRVWEVEPGRPWAATLLWATAAAALSWLLLARPWGQWRAFRLAPWTGAAV